MGNASIIGVGLSFAFPLACDMRNLREVAQGAPSEFVEAPVDAGIDHASCEGNDEEVFPPLRQTKLGHRLRKPNPYGWKQGDNDRRQQAQVTADVASTVANN